MPRPARPSTTIDLYRLTRPEDLLALAVDEIVSAPALVLVEWPERAGARLRERALPIDLEYVPGEPDRRYLLAG